MVACSQDLPPDIVGVGAIYIHNQIPLGVRGTPYDAHKRIDAEKNEVILTLSDGDNEATVATINREFAERQRNEAMILIEKKILLHGAVRGTGALFEELFFVTGVEASDGYGTTLFILRGTAFYPMGESGTLIELAVTNETIIHYSEF